MRRRVQAIQIQQHQIGALANFNATYFVFESHSASAVNRRHSKHRQRRKCFSAMKTFLNQRRRSHLGKHIKAVVAWSAVRTERYRDASLDHLRDSREP